MYFFFNTCISIFERNSLGGSDFVEKVSLFLFLIFCRFIRKKWGKGELRVWVFWRIRFFWFFR